MSLTQIERHEGPWTEADYLALPSRLWLALERARPQGREVFEAVGVRLGRLERAGPTAIVGRLVGDRYELSDAHPVLRMGDPFLAEPDLPALAAAERPQVGP